MAKLVIIRGPSGAGKSTIARAVAAATQRAVAVIGRDDYMEMFNHWPEAPDQELLRVVICFCLDRDIDVIFEGNFKLETHRELLEDLLSNHPEDNHLFYLDVGLEETIRRHRTRPARISEQRMRELYAATTPLHDAREIVVPETATVAGAVRIVLTTSGL